MPASQQTNSNLALDVIGHRCVNAEGAIGRQQRKMTSTTTTGLRGGSRIRHHESFNEVDAVGNPTELFRRINSGDWEGALHSVRTDPDGASTWISRHNGDDNGLVWKYLPLHLICLQQRPPMNLLMALLQVYPQAASLPTPHDGNLPLHYVCESGCDDENVFASLLASYPGSLEAKNNNGKSPLLVCHPKSRSVLMKVMRLRKSLPFDDVQQTKKRDKNKSKSKTGADQRDDGNTTPLDSRQDVVHQLISKPIPSRNTTDRKKSSVANSDESCEWKTAKTPKISNHRRRSTKQKQLQPPRDEPVFSFFPSTDSSSGSGGESDSSNYFSSKTSELARSALSFLYPSSREEPSDKQKEYPIHGHVMSLAAKILDQPKSTNEVNAEESKLCERILAQAEADNVAFRTQIQQLQEEKAEMKRAAALRESEFGEFIAKIKTIVDEKCSELKINAFGDGSSSHDTGGDSENQVVEAIQSLFSHVDERKSNLYSTIASLESDLSKSDVALKIIQSKNDLLQNDKNAMAKRYRELESKSLILEEDNVKAKKELVDLKDRANGLTVMNQALHDQVNSASHWKQEEIQLRSELDRVNALVIHLKELHAAETENKFKALLEKNQSLKDAILANNEKYSKKVQDLSEKNSALEKENKELKQSLEKKNLNGGSMPDVKVQLGRENSLLYEV